MILTGDIRDVAETLGPVDCIIADPPYGETSLAWDRWPDGWVQEVRPLLKEGAVASYIPALARVDFIGPSYTALRVERESGFAADGGFRSGGGTHSWILADIGPNRWLHAVCSLSSRT